MSGLRALVVEDEPRSARLVEVVLQGDGYDVRSVSSADEALRQFPIWQPDIVFLDIGLPGEMDGYQLCDEIRTFSAVPIIMLTGQGQTVDKVSGFAVGADDYITKPFAREELLARARAVLRRSMPARGTTEPETVVLGPWSLNLSSQRATLNGKELELTTTEFRLLTELVKNANTVIPHERLLKAVWGPQYGRETEYLRTYVRRLRSKIEEDSANPRHLLLKMGVGYELVVP